MIPIFPFEDLLQSLGMWTLNQCQRPESLINSSTCHSQTPGCKNSAKLNGVPPLRELFILPSIYLTWGLTTVCIFKSSTWIFLNQIQHTTQGCSVGNKTEERFCASLAFLFNTYHLYPALFTDNTSTANSLCSLYTHFFFLLFGLLSSLCVIPCGRLLL